MGKVLSSFTNGFAGAISRSVDDVVIALPNKSETEIGFGVAVVLSEDKDGVIPFDGSEHTAADFLGVTVRNPAKTPETYGKNTGTYADQDMVDVLVRGHIVVRMTNTQAKIGDPVSILKANGSFSTGSETYMIPLTNAHVSSAADGTGMAEIVLNTRNLV